MDTTDRQLEALLDDRRLLRAEIIQLEGAIYRTVLASFSATVVAAGLFWSQVFVANPSIRSTLIFVLVQVAIVLGAFVVALAAAMATLGGYIAAVEKRINTLLRVETSVWHARIAPETFWRRGGVAFYSVAFVILLFVALTAVLVYMAYSSFNSFGYGVFVTAELVALATLTTWTFREPQRIEKLASQLIGMPPRTG